VEITEFRSNVERVEISPFVENLFGESLKLPSLLIKVGVLVQDECVNR